MLPSFHPSILQYPNRTMQSFFIILHISRSISHPSQTSELGRPSDDYQISSSLLTISTVGVLGSNLFILFLSALVTKDGVIGTTGLNGW